MCKKEVKTVLKGLRNLADPPSSFKVVQSKHYRVRWDMKNDTGETVGMKATISGTPSDRSWKRIHKSDMRRQFRDKNVTNEIDYI